MMEQTLLQSQCTKPKECYSATVDFLTLGCVTTSRTDDSEQLFWGNSVLVCFG